LNENGIGWKVTDTHEDHLEFSGERMSAIIYYGSDKKGNLTLKRKIVWPMLRTLPNDTHASLIHDFPLAISPVIKINNRHIRNEKLDVVNFNGVLTLQSNIGQKITLIRTLSPSTTQPLLVEQLRLVNTGDSSVSVNVGELNYTFVTDENNGAYGAYTIVAKSKKSGDILLEKNETYTVNVQYLATKKGENVLFDANKEINKRLTYVASLQNNLQLVTPDPVLNKMFDFSKLRAAESIYRTKEGLMHGPGGGRYYAALWANDQAEYINPFFPFLGDKTGNESAINSYRHFARYMNDEFKAIPSSIIAEGIDIWDGAGDRGDCAMIAYGASRFALAYGNKAQATELLPLIDWCIAFSFNKMSKEGVIASDSDELEGRFPSGDYNLSTNMLTYGALTASTDLNRELGRIDLANNYEKKAKTLRSAMEKYFGSNVQGFETYRYYEGNKKLRAWIALPLTMGIFERKAGTLDALLSPLLWNENGIYSEAGNNTFWDRATLYAFRGIFAAKETDTAMRYFKYYSRKRLLGEHVPYAVEAWPEGNQRHLSAESALYARVVSEGIFGIEPTGFKQFNLAPYLPSEWDNMCLKNIRSFDENFNICVQRLKNEFEIVITKENGLVDKLSWNGMSPIKYHF